MSIEKKLTLTLGELRLEVDDTCWTLGDSNTDENYYEGLRMFGSPEKRNQLADLHEMLGFALDCINSGEV
jgi:hypothetical protein